MATVASAPPYTTDSLSTLTYKMANKLSGGITVTGSTSEIYRVGNTIRATATFTRPADTTAYASGDLVANSTTAGSVTPMSFAIGRFAGGSGMIRRARIRKSGTSVTNASFRIHLYNVSPTPSNGDNGAWLTNQAANYMGAIDVSVNTAFTDGAAGNGVPNIGSEINFAISSGTTVFGLLAATAAYTPASGESFSVELEVIQN